MKQTAKILWFSSEFPPGPGGLGTHAFQICRYLDGNGWKVTVLAPQDYSSPEDVSEFNKSVSFTIHTLPSGRGPVTESVHRFRTFRSLVKQEQPDLVIASGERAVWITALVCRLTLQRWAAVGHGTEYGLPSGWRAFLTRLALNRADLVIAVSKFTGGLIHRLGAKSRRMVVIPNGADQAQFMRLPGSQVEEFRNRIGMSEKKVILTVGQVTKRKGQEVVIRALPHVLEYVQGAHYFMAGLPTEQNALINLAKSLGVSEQVHFLGRLSRQELLLYMNACDVFAMTSRMTESGDCEGYGIATVEAALCGKPAVVAGESGLAEAVADGETGIVVPPNDVEATAKGLIRLLSDEQLCTTMGEKARRRALDEQTWENRGSQFENALRGILQREQHASEPVLEPA
ncbi:MAG: glycosyltransferase family 4 protein [Bacteroidetes bacterium]|nr:glycosyltransferase family 4 protein [Bacteroidota bacterium]MCW5897456.1 glycosyltransferase family 4 protein [Bacteroidota bacterium]